MSPEVVYEIARFESDEDGALLLERVQLLSAHGELLLRDASGSETRCDGPNAEAAISSTPSLREIRAGEHIRIACAPDIAARLPLILEPVLNGNASECYLEVNSEAWGAYPTPAEDYVLLPNATVSRGPEICPCWAEFWVEEQGEWSRSGPLASSLTGYSSIGLVTPGVVVEYASYDYGWDNEGSAVAIRPFGDFATVFVDWLVAGGARVLESLWVGSMAPSSPTVSLFVEAAAAADKKGRWRSDEDGQFQAADEQGDVDQDADGADDGAGYVYVDDDDADLDTSDWASARLALDLSDEQVDQVRARLGLCE